jgi:hypothetical protein
MKPLRSIAICARRTGVCKHFACMRAAQLFSPALPLSGRVSPQIVHATPALLASLSPASASAASIVSLLARLAPCVRPPALNVSRGPGRCRASSPRSSHLRIGSLPPHTRARIQRAARTHCRRAPSSRRLSARAVSPHTPSLHTPRLSARTISPRSASLCMHSASSHAPTYLSTRVAFCERSLSEPCTRSRSAPPRARHASPRRDAHRSRHL